MMYLTKKAAQSSLESVRKEIEELNNIPCTVLSYETVRSIQYHLVKLEGVIENEIAQFEACGK